MIRWLIPALILVIGLWWSYGNRKLIRDGILSYKWRTTKGRIIDKEDRSFLIPGFGGGSAGIATSECEYRETGYFYEYVVGMTRYVGDTYCFGVQIDKELARYIVGDYVTVWFDPTNPCRSVLKRGIAQGAAIPILLVLAGGGALIWILFAK